MTNLYENNYYENDSNWRYMSVSQFKDFIDCEAKALAKLNGEIPQDNTEAFLVGNYVHSAFESQQAHEDFLTVNQEAMLTKAGKIRAPFVQADLMVKRLESDDFFNKLYKGEKEVIVTGELFGTDWKGKIDCLNVDNDYFVDLKTTREVNYSMWSSKFNKRVSWVEEYGYIMQMAVYQQLLIQQYGKVFEPKIVAVSKESPPNIEAIEFFNDDLEFELEYVQVHIDRILKVKNGEEAPNHCGKCDYCRKTKHLTGFVNARELIR